MSTGGVIPFDQLGLNDIERVGGKNASLGEMITNLTQAGVKVPPGFATTAEVYKTFLSQQQTDQKLYELLGKLDVDDVTALNNAVRQIRQWIKALPLQTELIDQVKN